MKVCLCMCACKRITGKYKICKNRARLRPGKEWTIRKVCKLFLGGKFVFCFSFDSTHRVPVLYAWTQIGNSGEFMNLRGIPIGNWIFSLKFASYLPPAAGVAAKWPKEGQLGIGEGVSAPVKYLGRKHEYIEARETAGIGRRISGTGFGFGPAATVAPARWSAIRLWEYLELLLRTTVLRRKQQWTAPPAAP